jgi:rod shape-determining protein MreD
VHATLWQRLDGLARKLVPFATTILLVILSVMPWHLPGFGQVTPALSLMAVYYWAIFRPDLLPPPAVFAIGLLQDILAGVPLGVNAVTLLLVYAVVSSQRRFFLGKSFLVMWSGFVLVAAGVAAATWLLLAGFYGTLLNPVPAVFQGMLTLALFPCLTWLFIRAQNALLR